MAPSGSYRYTCSSDGALIACTVPSLDENVSSACLTGTSVGYNERCSFSCPTGYNLIGASTVTCTSSGNFSEPFPECVVSYNRQCYFVCQTGFSLTGPPSVTCTDSESFSQMFPRCEDNPVTCIVPSLEENVFSSCSPCTSVSYDDICSFSCATGYNLIGASNVTCTSSGSFSEPFPRCEALAYEFNALVQILSGRRKRAAVPIGSPEVQNLLDSIVLCKPESVMIG
ncbi:E-selectin-like [Strongylocentrotus purpuratus]|uniref:Sushi domain-containing protein n=1 Tax=Strongylocentrotus purpuratus TaxID=7668 RepID=A0A7M7P2A6_STRPU|nr:E-selectin-like [Strongylocentrotus purpuratus]